MTKAKEPVPKKPRAKTARKSAPRTRAPAAAAAPAAADAFVVENSTASVSLASDRVGYMFCTVTNQSSESIRGQVRLLSRPAEVADWLSIDEATEREFAGGDSQRYTIRIEAPPQAAVGKYDFRLLAQSADEPERVCTEGAAVALHIPQPRFIRMLPGVFQRGAPSGSPLYALLLVMEQMYAPGERTLNAIDDTFNPYRTPDAFVPYLASWVDLDRLMLETPGAYQNGSLPPFPAGLGRLRDLIAISAELSRWRGTARGLIQFLETATGVEGVQIEELPAGPNGQPLPFHMIVHLPAAAQAYRVLVERIVRMEKPAHMTYEIRYE